MFAGVYREMRKLGIRSPREVDEMEIWEIADALGVGREDENKPADRHAHLRARARARREGRPEPTFHSDELSSEDDDDGTALMTVLASGSSFG